MHCTSVQPPPTMRLWITSLRCGSPSPASPAPCEHVNRIGSTCTNNFKWRRMLRLLPPCFRRRRRLLIVTYCSPSLAASQPPAAGPVQSWLLLTAPGTLASRCVAVLRCRTASDRGSQQTPLPIGTAPTAVWPCFCTPPLLMQIDRGGTFTGVACACSPACTAPACCSSLVVSSAACRPSSSSPAWPEKCSWHPSQTVHAQPSALALLPQAMLPPQAVLKPPRCCC